jgi:hypothetical protein
MVRGAMGTDSGVIAHRSLNALIYRVAAPQLGAEATAGRRHVGHALFVPRSSRPRPMHNSFLTGVLRLLVVIITR